ncbi:MAG: hypothetical protein J0I06_26630 [Planctomycetes bacterium]|nr:hypothetical protein [Planctomycetota bacterium]
MRNVLALFGLLIIGFVGLGWYMGWYKLSVSRTADGNLEIKTDVNTKKVGADASDAIKNAGSVIGSHVDKAAHDAKAVTPPAAPGGTPGPVTPPQNLPSIPAVAGPPVPAAPEMPTLPIPPVPAAPTPAPAGPMPIQLIPPK